jgi:hypothetical protein
MMIGVMLLQVNQSGLVQNGRIMIFEKMDQHGLPIEIYLEDKDIAVEIVKSER